MATPSTVPESVSRVVKVRSVDGEEKMNVILEDSWGHHHRMLRNKDEHVSKTLKRIVLSSQKLKGGTRKRKRTDPVKASDEVVPPIEAHLYTPSGEAVESEVPNGVAWEEGGILRVGSIQYRVCVNRPVILALKLSRYPMTGCPVVPQVRKEGREGGVVAL